MRVITILSTAAIASVAALATSSAQTAADYAAQSGVFKYYVPVTLHVPVTLTNLASQYDTVGVRCGLGPYVATSSRTATKWVTVVVDTTMPIRNGAYSGTVSFTTNAGVNASGDQWRYQCGLELRDAVAKQWLTFNGHDISSPGATIFVTEAAAPNSTPIIDQTGAITFTASSNQKTLNAAAAKKP